MRFESDLNKTVFNHRPGACRTVDGIANGSEDIELIRNRNIAFVSSGIMYLAPRTPGVKGQIFLYDFTKPGHKAELLKITGSLDQDTFGPHGMTSYEINGELHLLVVNHPGMSLHSIEEFIYDEKSRSLKHVKTIKDENFVRPNDIVAVGPGKFLVNNDGSFQTQTGNGIEMLLELKAGSIVYYDGKKSHILQSSHQSPNGIAVDAQKKFLYVACPNGKKLFVYSLNKDFTKITLVNEVPLNTAPDNLFVDETGAVWTGAHPILYKAMQYCTSPQDKSVLAPSQVLRIKFSPDHKKYEVTEPYANDGTELAGSTVAVYHQKQLLIGTVHRTLLHCDVADGTVI